jgi:flagellar hook protein FlgE
MQVAAIATSGLMQALRLTEMRAQNIARLGDTSAKVDVAQEIVGLMGAQHSFEANLKVLKTADEMIGALLDLKA